MFTSFSELPFFCGGSNFSVILGCRVELPCFAILLGSWGYKRKPFINNNNNKNINIKYATRSIRNNL
jgi:hypothetical protein